MNASITPVESGVQKLSLEGRLDIAGTESIALKLNALAATDKQFIVADLSKVDFMASIGIGVLVRCAKALRLRGGNMVLLNPQPGVRMMLEKTQIHSVIPICTSLADASKLVKESPPSVGPNAL